MLTAESQTTPTPFSQDIFCQDCGYNLRGLTGERCPECGRSLAGLRNNVSQIPWVHRKKIGRFRTYWKTVWFVTVRTRLFGEEMARPVSYPDSQSFRWITVAVTSLFFLSIAGVTYAFIPPISVNGNDLFEALYSLVVPVVLMFIGVVLSLAACTGLPSFFFHPRIIDVAQQNRAIALSYYACGPLVMLGAPILALDAAIILFEIDEIIALFFLIFAMTLPVGPVAAWWLDLIHLSRRLLPQRSSRAIWVALMVPFLWLVSGVLLIVVLPVLLMYPFLVYFSLQQ